MRLFYTIFSDIHINFLIYFFKFRYLKLSLRNLSFFSIFLIITLIFFMDYYKTIILYSILLKFRKIERETTVCQLVIANFLIFPEFCILVRIVFQFYTYFFLIFCFTFLNFFFVSSTSLIHQDFKNLFFSAYTFLILSPVFLKSVFEFSQT